MTNSVNMPHTPSVMSLHLRYRLWIAEMNSDINILRILDDYLNAIAFKNTEPDVIAKIDYFQKQFTSARKDIDELRHEMHLLKMKLAAFSKEMKPLSYKIYQSDNHSDLKKRYLGFTKIFDKLKEEFKKFEAEYLD